MYTISYVYIILDFNVNVALHRTAICDVTRSAPAEFREVLWMKGSSLSRIPGCFVAGAGKGGRRPNFLRIVQKTGEMDSTQLQDHWSGAVLAPDVFSKLEQTHFSAKGKITLF